MTRSLIAKWFVGTLIFCSGAVSTFFIVKSFRDDKSKRENKKENSTTSS